MFSMEKINGLTPCLCQKICSCQLNQCRQGRESIVNVAWPAAGHHCNVLMLHVNINEHGIVQNCLISIANTLEILESCSKPLKCSEK